MIGTGEHHLTGSQLRFHIAYLTLLSAAEVAAGVSPHIAEGPEILLRMHHNGVILGLGEVQQRLLHLIAHLDAVQGFAGCFGGFRCHDRHRISGTADLPVENQTVIGAGLRIGLSGGGEPALGHILPGIDRHYARDLHRCGTVDLLDPSPGIGTAQQFDGQGACRHQIACIYRLAGHQCLGILFADCPADKFCFAHARLASFRSVRYRRMARS